MKKTKNKKRYLIAVIVEKPCYLEDVFPVIWCIPTSVEQHSSEMLLARALEALCVYKNCISSRFA